MDIIAEKYINPFTDFGFKKLFGTEVNKDLFAKMPIQTHLTRLLIF